MTQNTDVLHVLYLPHGVPSIDYRAYADDSQPFVVLEWLLQRVSRLAPVEAFLLLCHDERDHDLGKASGGAGGHFVFRSPMRNKLAALADVALAFGVNTIATFGVEIAFAPTDLLQRVVSFHRNSSSDYTYVTGLPHRVCPEVFSRDLLLKLSAIEYDGPPPDAGALAREFARLRPGQILASEFFVPDSRDTPGAWDDALSLNDAIDAQRACISLQGLPEEYSFQALERWQAASTIEAPIPRFTGPAAASKQKRILYVSSASAYSGAEECLRGLVEGLGHHPFDSYALIGVEGLLARRLREAGASVACANWNFHQAGADTDRLVQHVLDVARPHLLHCNSNPGDALIEAAKDRGIPVVTHVRIVRSERLGAAMGTSDGYLCVSEFIRSRLLDAGYPGRKLRVAYDGVDPDAFCPGVFDKARMRAEFELPADAFVVLMIARVEENKRHELLLEATARTLSQLPELHIVMVNSFGTRDLHARLHSKTRELGLVSRVSVLPFQRDIRRIECAADVLVLPSDHEPLGTCVLESMALGKPVIVSDNGGTRELVEHDASGLEFTAGDASSLADAMVYLGRDAALASRMGSLGRSRVLERFTLRHHAAAVAELFHELA